MSHSLVVSATDHRRLTALLASEFVKAIAPCDYLHDLRIALRRCRIVDDICRLEDVVSMNTTVVLRDLKTSEVETLLLVYPEVADIGRGLLSVLAPMGAAIVGRCVGDRVNYSVADGERVLAIEAVRHSKLQPAWQPQWMIRCEHNSLADRL